MNSQRLERVQHQASQEAERKTSIERRRRQHQQKEQQRLESRIERFENLAARNHALNQRAANLFAISGSSPIILKRPNEKSPDTGAVGRMHQIPYVSARYPKTGIWQFSIEAIGREAIENIEASPPSSRKGIRTSDRHVVQQTYGMINGAPLGGNDNTWEDEIVWTAKEYSAGTFLHFNPVNALWRQYIYSYTRKHLDELEETMTLFEEAAPNPELNPQLVPFFKHAQ